MADKKITVLHKRSSVKGKLPKAEDLMYGEIAINYTKDSETISIKNSADEVVPFSSDTTIINKAVEKAVEKVGNSVLPTYNTGDADKVLKVKADGSALEWGEGRRRNGFTFTPSVSSDGTLSWTNDGGLNNPNSVNIKGPQGERGQKGEPGKDGTGISLKASRAECTKVGDAYLETNGHIMIHNGTGFTDGGEIRGPQGPQGERGPQGLQGIQGVPGQVGPQGQQGERGPKGDNGLPGPQGQQGERGPKGDNGVNGSTSYVHIKYSNDGGRSFTANNGNTVGDYLGQYVDFNSTDSNNPSAYKWAKIKGEQGPVGQRGQDGARGERGENGTSGKNGADGMTPMPNLLKGSDFATNKVSVSESENNGAIWKSQIELEAIIAHEPAIVAPHTGAKVISCTSFKRSTTTEDKQCYGSIFQEIELTKGVTYTLSVYAKGDNAGWMISWPIDGTHQKLEEPQKLTLNNNTAQGWKRYAITFTPNKSGKTTIYLRSWSRSKHEEGGTVYFACPKLEESAHATPWMLAQADFKGDPGTNANVTAGSNIAVNNGQVSVVDAPTFSGRVTASAFYESSDRSLKENITSVTDTDKVANVDFKEFNYIADDSKTKKYGVIAQELEELGLNNLVQKNSDGKKSVDYISLLCLKVAELTKELDELKAKLAKKP